MIIDNTFYRKFFEYLCLYDETDHFTELDSEMENDMANSLLRYSNNNSSSILKIKNITDNTHFYIGYYPNKEKSNIDFSFLIVPNIIPLMDNYIVKAKWTCANGSYSKIEY